MVVVGRCTNREGVEEKEVDPRDTDDATTGLVTCSAASAMAARLKWGKRTFDLAIESGSNGEALKQVVESLTGVPPDRQKLLCTKLWKGALKGDTVAVLPEIPPSKGKLGSL